MKSIIANLRNYWDEDGIANLIFLKTYLDKNDKTYLFDFIEKNCRKYDTKILQQVIKCVTHNIPYQPLLFENVTVEQAIEIRRFMEDTGCESLGCKFIFIAEQLRYFDASIIYEFRRFNKAPTPITYEQDIELLSWMINHLITHGTSWMILASLYEVYIQQGFDAMEKFADGRIDEYRKFEKVGAMGCFHMDTLINMWHAANDEETDVTPYDYSKHDG